MEVLNDLMDAVRSLLDLAAIKLGIRHNFIQCSHSNCLNNNYPIPALLGVEPEVFTTSVISSFLAVVIWSAYTLFVVSRVIQKGGDDKSVGLRREESKASATNLQCKYLHNSCMHMLLLYTQSSGCFLPLYFTSP